jgi:hypothetical protein
MPARPPPVVAVVAVPFDGAPLVVSPHALDTHHAMAMKSKNFGLVTWVRLGVPSS